MTAEPDLAPTRASLHAIAEHLLAGALHRATARIGLRPSPGGFATPTFGAADHPVRLRVDGVDVVSERGGHEVARSTARTLGGIAADLGLEVAGPRGVYQLQTPPDADAPLVLDPDAAAIVAGWFALGDDALGRLAAAHGDLDWAEPQLWPEHFDLATSAGEVNYGASPGDAEHPLPYLYVGPWTPPERDGDYWNEPFGASLPYRPGLGVEDAVAFFEEGRGRLSGAV